MLKEAELLIVFLPFLKNRPSTVGKVLVLVDLFHLSSLLIRNHVVAGPFFNKTLSLLFRILHLIVPQFAWFCCNSHASCWLSPCL
jgi:hypothetical protein